MKVNVKNCTEKTQRWPRGKYNGKKIVGFTLHFRFDITYWSFRIGWDNYNPYLHFGCFHLRFEPAYDYADNAKLTGKKGLK